MPSTRRAYDLWYKRRAIEAFDGRGLISPVARDYNIDRRTLRSWLERRDEIYQATGETASKRKCHPGPAIKYPDADEELHQYLILERRAGRAVMNKDLCSKMRMLCGTGNFVASHQWLKGTKILLMIYSMEEASQN
jgi:hypothetical protein